MEGCVVETRSYKNGRQVFGSYNHPTVKARLASGSENVVMMGGDVQNARK
jgi:hypothetical protein